MDTDMENPEANSEDAEMLESIIGEDDRYAPDNIHDDLWRPICAVFFNVPGKRTGYLGSGVVIGRRLVLTAAHNLFDLKTRQPIMGGDVRVGVKNGVSEASSPISMIQVLKRYQNRKDADERKYNDDYGLILLQNDAVNEWVRDENVWSIEDMTPPNNRVLKSSTLLVAGYPADDGESGAELKLSKGPVMRGSVTSKTFGYEMDTTPGQSGGPVFSYDEATNKVALAGVHVAGFGQDGNLANRFGPGTKKQVRTWSQLLTNVGV